MKLKGYDFAGIVPIDFIDLLMQMTIVLTQALRCSSSLDANPKPPFSLRRRMVSIIAVTTICQFHGVWRNNHSSPSG